MKLTAAKRAATPKSKFAGPGKSFPLTDKVHDRMAISGATRSYNAGNISKGTENRIKGEARNKLGITMKEKKVSTKHSHGLKPLSPSKKMPLDMDDHHKTQKVTGKGKMC